MTSAKIQEIISINLYEQGFSLWLETTVNQLKQGNLDQDETELSVNVFPDICPFTIEETLNE